MFYSLVNPIICNCYNWATGVNGSKAFEIRVRKIVIIDSFVAPDSLKYSPDTDVF